MQCPKEFDGRQCIYVEGHGGECFAPTDGRDHSDEIRIRVLKDRIVALEARLAASTK